VLSFTPTSGAVGQKVTIEGINLDGASKVVFSGASATISSDTASKLKVTVPVGATTGKVKVVTPGGKATSATSFSVIPTVSFNQATTGLYQGGPVELTLSSPSTTAVVVSFKTSDGPESATQSAEWLGSAQSFTPRRGTVTFAPGVTNATFSFTVTQTTITGCSIGTSNCLPSLTVTLFDPKNALLDATPTADLFYWG
jgi:hypothetical protein